MSDSDNSDIFTIIFEGRMRLGGQIIHPENRQARIENIEIPELEAEHARFRKVWSKGGGTILEKDNTDDSPVDE